MLSLVVLSLVAFATQQRRLSLGSKEGSLVRIESGGQYRTVKEMTKAWGLEHPRTAAEREELIVKLVVARDSLGVGEENLPSSAKESDAKASKTIEEPIQLLSNDSMMGKKSWDSSPIVVKQFKLILFTIPKVGCTVVKQLARRMAGFADWFRGDDKIPHNPHFNGLTLLRHLPLQDAQRIMNDKSWTRAVFVREPKERLLSAYLDKVKRTNYVSQICHQEPVDFQAFISLTKTCKDSHWNAQSTIVDPKWWPTIGFVGKMSTATEDMERLLKRVGAWADYGATGWGKDRNQAIFRTNALPGRATHSKAKYAEHFTPSLEALVESIYKDDFERFNFPMAHPN